MFPRSRTAHPTSRPDRKSAVTRFLHYYIKLVTYINNAIIAPVKEIGDIVIFFGRTLKTISGVPKSIRLIFDSMLEIGFRSIPITFVISVFAGATTAWQANYQLEGYVSMRYLGTAVSKAIILELGPVFTGLVVAGRIGSSIAASLGAMRVTEQIDALATMAINPFRYLVMPRVMAAMVMLPILTIYSCFFGIAGGMFVSMHFLGVSQGIFLSRKFRAISRT